MARKNEGLSFAEIITLILLVEKQITNAENNLGEAFRHMTESISKPFLLMWRAAIEQLSPGALAPKCIHWAFGMDQKS